jgi:Domain of unknown function (DUF1877)
MGLSAGIYAISERSYAAALVGNSKDFVVHHAVDGLDLDKAWHAIHFAITGDASLKFLLSGIQIPGVSEHCEVHSPGSVKALERAISARSVEGIISALDPTALSELKIYPGGWSDDSKSYVAQYMEQFSAKLREITCHSLGMLVVIS